MHDSLGLLGFFISFGLFLEKLLSFPQLDMDLLQQFIKHSTIAHEEKDITLPKTFNLCFKRKFFPQPF